MNRLTFFLLAALLFCALSLVSLVIGPFAAAASLRHGLD